MNLFCSYAYLIFPLTMIITFTACEQKKADNSFSVGVVDCGLGTSQEMNRSAYLKLTTNEPNKAFDPNSLTAAIVSPNENKALALTEKGCIQKPELPEGASLVLFGTISGRAYGAVTRSLKGTSIELNDLTDDYLNLSCPKNVIYGASESRSFKHGIELSVPSGQFYYGIETRLTGGDDLTLTTEPIRTTFDSRVTELDIDLTNLPDGTYTLTTQRINILNPKQRLDALECQVIIDTTEPELDILDVDLDGSNALTPFQSVSLVISDANPGEAFYCIRERNSAPGSCDFQKVTGPITMPESGYFTLDFYSVDRSKNKSQIKSANLRIYDEQKLNDLEFSFLDGLSRIDRNQKLNGMTRILDAEIRRRNMPTQEEQEAQKLNSFFAMLKSSGSDPELFSRDYFNQNVSIVEEIAAYIPEAQAIELLNLSNKSTIARYEFAPELFEVKNIAISQDRTMLVAEVLKLDSSNFGACIFQLNTNLILDRCFYHEEGIASSLMIAPDNTRFALGLNFQDSLLVGTIEQESFFLVEDVKATLPISFSQDSSKLLLTALDLKTIYSIDANNGEKTLVQESRTPESIDFQEFALFAANGNVIKIDQEISLIDQDLSIVFQTDTEDLKPEFVKLSSDRSLLYVLDDGSTLKIYSIADANVSLFREIPDISRFSQLHTFEQNGQFAIADSRRISVYDLFVKNLIPIRVIDINEDNDSFFRGFDSFSSQSGYLLTSTSSDKKHKFWDLNALFVPYVTAYETDWNDEPTGINIQSLSLVPHSDRLIIRGEFNVSVFGPGNQSFSTDSIFLLSDVSGSKTKPWIATAGAEDDYEASIWDYERQTKLFSIPHDDVVERVFFQDDLSETDLITVTPQTINWWTFNEDGATLDRSMEHNHFGFHKILNLQGQEFLFASGQVWAEGSSGAFDESLCQIENAGQFKEHKAANKITVNNLGGEVLIFDTQDYSCRTYKFDLNAGNFLAGVAVTEQGEILVAGSNQGYLELFDSEGKPLRTYKNDSKKFKIAYDSRNRVFYTGNEFGNISVWDLNSEEKLGQIKHDQTSQVDFLQITDDGQYLISSSTQNNNTRKWKLNFEELFRDLCDFNPDCEF
ncbi:MAG: WD40 repeat domain-containing protein [Pseudobacteriovorax sp.]|nr:WD40 repeat domain-containing protein [Pseudobacteriovorax sp.]